MAKKQGVNKSDKVREYLAVHPDAGGKEVVEALKDYNISQALVYQIKRKNRSGRRQKAPKKGAARAGSLRGTRGRAAARKSREPVVAAAELIQMCGGVEEAKAALQTAGDVAAVLR